MNSKNIDLLSALALTAFMTSESKAEEQNDPICKCYGVAETGDNDCTSLTGEFSCAGQSSVDKDIATYKVLRESECKKKNGFSSDEAKKKLIAKGRKIVEESKGSG